ncbi:MAG TPA: MotA/TolQ/ExbB proton channel family protein [Gammaproteobacteria bacterium]|jgi:biopolymer transport protein ExbB
MTSLRADFAGNAVIWAILALALFCYVLLFNLALGDRDVPWKRQAGIWLKILPVLLAALPLLGLLGTIEGLLTTFRGLGRSGAADLNQQVLVSSGIANALITTQLGLIMVIPGLLLYSYVRRRHREHG